MSDQLLGFVNQDREVLDADVNLLPLKQQGEHRDLVISAFAVNAVGRGFSHRFSVLIGGISLSVYPGICLHRQFVYRQNTPG